MEDGGQKYQGILEALDREIAFYRRRSGQVFFFGLLVEAFILAGREQVFLKEEGWEVQRAIIYTIFFIAVAAVGIFLGSEYRRRIHKLKKSRLELFKELGKPNLYPTDKDQWLSEIQVLYFVLTFLSSTGIVLVWVKGYKVQLILYIFVAIVCLVFLALIFWAFWKAKSNSENQTVEA